MVANNDVEKVLLEIVSDTNNFMAVPFLWYDGIYDDDLFSFCSLDCCAVLV